MLFGNVNANEDFSIHFSSPWCCEIGSPFWYTGLGALATVRTVRKRGYGDPAPLRSYHLGGNGLPHPLILYHPLLYQGVRGRGEGPGAPKHHPRGCFKKAKLNKENAPLSVYYLCALINSPILAFWFKRVFVFEDRLFPYARVSQISWLPIRRIAFTTPADERARRVEEGKALAEAWVAARQGEMGEDGRCVYPFPSSPTGRNPPPCACGTPLGSGKWVTTSLCPAGRMRGSKCSSGRLSGWRPVRSNCG